MDTRSKTATLFVFLIILFTVQPLLAQNSSDRNNFKDQFTNSFNYASRVLDLAKAMPAENYDWRPMEEVSSVQEVYTHIAHYNFAYLENHFDIPIPEDIDVDNIESITGKEEVVTILERSINHVNDAMKQIPASALGESTTLYGRETNKQAVLLQLINHMSEHVGQSIAYARMNEVVPPWNQ